MAETSETNFCVHLNAKNGGWSEGSLRRLSRNETEAVLKSFFFRRLLSSLQLCNTPGLYSRYNLATISNVLQSDRQFDATATEEFGLLESIVTSILSICSHWTATLLRERNFNGDFQDYVESLSEAFLEFFRLCQVDASNDSSQTSLELDRSGFYMKCGFSIYASREVKSICDSRSIYSEIVRESNQVTKVIDKLETVVIKSPLWTNIDLALVKLFIEECRFTPQVLPWLYNLFSNLSVELTVLPTDLFDDASFVDAAHLNEELLKEDNYFCGEAHLSKNFTWQLAVAGLHRFSLFKHVLIQQYKFLKLKIFLVEMLEASSDDTNPRDASRTDQLMWRFLYLAFVLSLDDIIPHTSVTQTTIFPGSLQLSTLRNHNVSQRAMSTNSLLFQFFTSLSLDLPLWQQVSECRPSPSSLLSLFLYHTSEYSSLMKLSSIACHVGDVDCLRVSRFSSLVAVSSFQILASKHQGATVVDDKAFLEQRLLVAGKSIIDAAPIVVDSATKHKVLQPSDVAAGQQRFGLDDIRGFVEEYFAAQSTDESKIVFDGFMKLSRDNLLKAAINSYAPAACGNPVAFFIENIPAHFTHHILRLSYNADAIEYFRRSRDTSIPSNITVSLAYHSCIVWGKSLETVKTLYCCDCPDSDFAKKIESDLRSCWYHAFECALELCDLDQALTATGYLYQLESSRQATTEDCGILLRWKMCIRALLYRACEVGRLDWLSSCQDFKCFHNMTLSSIWLDEMEKIAVTSPVISTDDEFRALDLQPLNSNNIAFFECLIAVLIRKTYFSESCRISLALFSRLTFESDLFAHLRISALLIAMSSLSVIDDHQRFVVHPKYQHDQSDRLRTVRVLDHSAKSLNCVGLLDLQIQLLIVKALHRLRISSSSSYTLNAPFLDGLVRNLCRNGFVSDAIDIALLLSHARHYQGTSSDLASDALAEISKIPHEFICSLLQPSLKCMAACCFDSSLQCDLTKYTSYYLIRSGTSILSYSSHGWTPLLDVVATLDICNRIQYAHMSALDLFLDKKSQFKGVGVPNSLLLSYFEFAPNPYPALQSLFRSGDLIGAHDVVTQIFDKKCEPPFDLIDKIVVLYRYILSQSSDSFISEKLLFRKALRRILALVRCWLKNH